MLQARLTVEPNLTSWTSTAVTNGVQKVAVVINPKMHEMKISFIVC